MNAKEATDRLAITINDLGGPRFLVGILDKREKDYRCFLEKKDMTNDLFSCLLEYLEDGKFAWPFTDSKGIVRRIKIEKPDESRNCEDCKLHETPDCKSDCIKPWFNNFKKIEGE